MHESLKRMIALYINSSKYNWHVIMLESNEYIVYTW